MKKTLALVAICLLGGCSENTEDLPGRSTTTNAAPAQDRLLPTDQSLLVTRAPPNPERNAYFGDLHVHTTYSFDAFAFGTTATPADAYRYAMGEVVQHPSGFNMQLRKPLDFYAVTDHASFLGVAREAADTSTDFSQLQISRPLHNLNKPNNLGLSTLAFRARTFGSLNRRLLQAIRNGSVDPDMITDIIRRSWHETVRAADQYNTPGTLTTFVAYEYTSSTDEGGNLHRNVIFRDSDRLPGAPFSALNSQNPEGLWQWMDDLRAQGIESLAIPHNSNASNGAMFALRDWAGNPIDQEYADTRMRNEPLVEVTQVKGTSETHPTLSSNDEWANFEIMPYRIGTLIPSSPPGGYARDAYLRGLGLQREGGGNPYKFGLIGSTDTHVAAGSDREDDFWSKSGLMDGQAMLRGAVPLSLLEGTAATFIAPSMVKTIGGNKYFSSSSFETFGSSGLAAVWAEENTRGAIYNALRRKEAFATSGPRMQVRFFAGYDFTEDMLQSPDMVQQAYATGVSMGGDLPANGRHPQFLVWAQRDEASAPLQRIQIIKGYLRDGKHAEQVYDVACSDGLQPDPQTHRCPDNGARVDLKDCRISTDVGAAQLLKLWRDPDFDVDVNAFYYVRVLENPACRWSTWDALRDGAEPRQDLAPTIQERAWSSPIWYLVGGS